MIPYKTVLKVAPTVEPITLDEAKAQLRLTALQTFDDTYITALIPVARDRVESYTNRFFTTQQITIIWEAGFPVGDLSLPYPDLTSVDEVSYTDSSGVETMVDSGAYTFDSERQVLIADSWPSDAVAIKIDVTTGAPLEFEGAKQAMLMMLTDMYELRTESVIGASVADNPAVTAMLYPYRVNLGIQLCFDPVNLTSR